LATARRIADSVRDTMQAALRIQSPSRIMRDEVGGPITEGIAVGMDASSQDALTSASSLSKSLTDAFTIQPNVSLASLIGPTPTLASTSNGGVVNHYHLFEGASIQWNNKADIRETMEEIAWATQRESARMW